MVSMMINVAPIEASPNARRDFILANTRLLAPPLAPEIRLRLADEAVPLWKKTEEELGAIGLPPPFWAFAWAGGQALARYALDNPALTAGRRALDFASGSGLVAITAAMSGAAAVEASDIDAFAIAAVEANAAENSASVAPRLETSSAPTRAGRSCSRATSPMRRTSGRRRWNGWPGLRAGARPCSSAIPGAPIFRLTASTA